MIQIYCYERKLSYLCTRKQRGNKLFIFLYIMCFVFAEVRVNSYPSFIFLCILLFVIKCCIFAGELIINHYTNSIATCDSLLSYR